MALKAYLETTSSPADDSQADAKPDRRRHPRRALRLETNGRVEDFEANVTVHNLSAVGLLIETELPLDVGEVLSINMPDIGPVGAEIVWESGNLFGCAFEQALGEAALAAALLRGDVPGAKVAQKPPQVLPSGDPLGVRLNRLRRERSLTLAQVAAALGVSKPTVWAWEKGKARPLPERIEAIAEVLGVEPEELVDNGQRGEAASVVDDCRLRIATAYGTQPQFIRIMIEV